jgi:hypothetical protein
MPIPRESRAHPGGGCRMSGGTLKGRPRATGRLSIPTYDALIAGARFDLSLYRERLPLACVPAHVAGS